MPTLVTARGNSSVPGFPPGKRASVRMAAGDSRVPTTLPNLPFMPKFSAHIFVCCNQRSPGHPRGCCDLDGAGRLREAFKEELKRRRLGVEVRANQAGCLEQCEYGPALVIYPQGVWYGQVQPEDVPRIVEETVVGGRVLADLLIPDDCLNSKGRVPWQRGSDGDHRETP